MNSFIPYELKRHFGLPTYSDKDAIFAYHFYRLIQRAKNITLVYNTESDALGSGEKSRFLTQLIYELPKVNPAVKLKEQLLNVPALDAYTGTMAPVQKTEWVLDKLRARAEYGLSPSVLNRYRNCQMQFYFQAVAGLKEADEIEETIGADVLGSAIHSVLEKLYTPYIGKNLHVADVRAMKPAVEQLMQDAFAEKYDINEISHGKNLLTLRVANRFVQNFLDSEIRGLQQLEKEGKPLMIKSLEEDLETVVRCGEQEIKVRGKADRIDLLGNVTRIIDYKTGQAADNELRFAEWDTIANDPTLDKSFQLLMYALMYQRKNPHIETNIQSGIITFRELSAGLKSVSALGHKSIDKLLLDDFEKQVSKIVTEIFDEATPFVQTTDPERCIYCSFKGICNRA
jgi:ATP-dependent helicase/DNAse subunit B